MILNLKIIFVAGYIRYYRLWKHASVPMVVHWCPYKCYK